MAKKKRQRGEIRKVRPEDIKPGPLRHKEGLTQLLEKLARVLFAKAGHLVYPSFEQWELGFMRDTHPWREILVWENIARTFDLYVAEHPEAANSTEILGTIVSISTGHVSTDETATEKELRNLYTEAHKSRWLSPLEEPFEFPPDNAPVLEYKDIVEEKDGQVYPNIRCEMDCRRVLADADVIIGMDSISGEHVCIYGREHIEDGTVPGGLKTVVVRLDAENNETLELAKMCFIVERIKGRHDCR